MRRYAVILVFGSVWGLPAYADVVVDQENAGSCCFGTSLEFQEEFLIQTFTIGNSGQLAGVGVRVSISGYSDYRPVTDDLHVSLMRTNSLGVPNIGEVIASQTISRYALPRWSVDAPMFNLDFSPWNVNVRRGDKLGIALSTNHTYSDYPRGYDQYLWHASSHNPYPGGEYYAYSPRLFGPVPFLVHDSYEPPNDTRDMGFRILVDIVPEPMSVAIVLSCTVLSLFFGRVRLLG